MTDVTKNWTGNIDLNSNIEINTLLNNIAQAFNSSPFFLHNAMKMTVIDGQIEARVDMASNLIGNVAFQILHGGVAATLLDRIGGITAMAELYKKATAEDLAERSKKLRFKVIVDMQVGN